MDKLTLLYLTVGSGALLWAVENIIISYYSRYRKIKVHEDILLVALSLGITTVSFLVEIVWSYWHRGNYLSDIEPGFWWPFIALAVFNVVIQYINVKAYQLEDASVIAPLASTMPMFVIFMSWLMLGEWPTFYGRIGIGFIAFGAYTLRLEKSKVELPDRIKKIVPVNLHDSVKFYLGPWIRLLSSKGAKLALLMAYLGAIAINFDKLAVLSSSPMVANGGVYLIVAIFVYIWSKIRGVWDNNFDPSAFKRIFMAGFFLIGMSEILMATGFYYGIVPYVASLKRTQILWTVMLSSLLLKEKNFLYRIVGASIIFVGTVLIAF